MDDAFEIPPVPHPIRRADRRRAELLALCRGGDVARAVDLAFEHLADVGDDATVRRALDAAAGDGADLDPAVRSRLADLRRAQGHTAPGRGRVVVAGGGVGGLGAALCLSRAGWEVEVHERAPSLRGAGGGLGLQPNGLAVLDALGLLDGLRRDGSVLDHVSLFGAGGQVLSRLPVPPHPPVAMATLVVRRGALIDRLAEAVREAGIAVHLGSTVTRGTGGAAGISDAGGRRVEEADLVVAADGAGSHLRAAAGVRSRPFGVRRWYLRFLAPVPTQHDVVGERWSVGGIAGVLPCGEGETYVFATASGPVRAADARGDLAATRAELGRDFPFLAPYLDTLGSTGDILLNDVRAVRCHRFVGDRLALLGDAAHAMAPNLAQGANSALVDAAVLTAELDHAGDVPAALVAYDRRRRRTVQRVQRRAEILAFAGHVRRGIALRDALAGHSPATVQLRALAQAQQCDPAELAVELLASWPTTAGDDPEPPR